MSIAELYRSISPGGIAPAQANPPAKQNTPAKGADDFQKLLQGEQSKIDLSRGEPKLWELKLNLSQHAETRIRSREIPWDAAIEQRVNRGIDQAQAKGSRETLILADNLAVIANVKSRTVITAMDRSQLKERIFTNIDSAVLV